MFASQGGLYRVSEGGGEPEAITTLGEGERDHYWPDIIDGRGAVVFTIVRDGGAPIETGTLGVLDLESGQVTNLDVQGVSRYVSTGHIVYAASDGSMRAVPFDVETLTVTGTTVPLLEGLQVKGSGAADFDVSDRGRLIHTSGGGRGGDATRSVLWGDRDGREEPLGITPQGYVYPRLSPDGQRLALDDRGNETGVWIWDFGIETLTRLVLGEGNFMYQVWSPDGTRLAYSEPASADIRWKAANNTGNPTVLLEGIGGAGTQQPEVYFFTPDGEHVVLRQQQIPETRDDLLMVALDGSGEPVWRLGGDFDERNAELSPDGRWMAYQSRESGQFEIYVRPFPDVESDQVQVSNAGGTKPVWSPAGGELFYLQPGSPTELISVQVEPAAPGERFRPGLRQVLLDWPYYDSGEGRAYEVSADGQRFLAIDPTGGGGEAGGPQMTIVMNWFEELRERMGSD